MATWKLDRRRGAGQSADDVKTVARAQGDVRQRTERAASASRGPRRRPSAGTGDADPLASAAAAMARAQGALDATNTGAAVGPEMEALNHLLRAQAENRRREVMRQQAGMGGGGGNRAQQDLSSLFDRELKRQQQTNYETPRTAEDREQNGADDLLERLRALAARQEQLARQQDDLAKSADQLEAEERRRRLERLTREQTEVRRQAEQLAQQLQAAGQQGAERDGKGSNPGAASASGVRDASEEMQAAAGDLRREDARNRRARGARGPPSGCGGSNARCRARPPTNSAARSVICSSRRASWRSASGRSATRPQAARARPGLPASRADSRRSRIDWPTAPTASSSRWTPFRGARMDRRGQVDARGQPGTEGSARRAGHA